MQIVVEEQPMTTHCRIQGLFPCMAERRMPQIMHQGQRFHEVHIQAKLRGNRPGDLSDFNSVGQAAAEVVGIAACENLRLGLQSAKSAGMNNAVAVPFKVVAIRMKKLGMAASARLFHAYRIVGEHGESLSEAVP